MKMFITHRNGNIQEKNVRNAAGAELLVQAMIDWTLNGGVEAAELSRGGVIIARWIRKGNGNPQCMTLEVATREYMGMH